MGYQITRTLIAHPSFTDMVLPLLTDYVRETLNEESCLGMTIYKHKMAINLYILHGEWTTEIAYLYHIDQRRYKSFLHVTSAMLMQPSDYQQLNVLPI